MMFHLNLTGRTLESMASNLRRFASNLETVASTDTTNGTGIGLQPH